MNNFLGLHHPFFRPLIRRLLTLATIAIYGVVELIYGSTGWAIFALCLGVFCIFAFFIKPDPQA